MVAWKKQITEKFLRSSRCESKICNKKLQNVVFTGTEWSLLANITNTLMKILNSSFKKLLNETFTSQLKPNWKQIQEVLHGTAKTITKDIENEWDEKVVETKSATSATFWDFFHEIRGGGERWINFDSILIRYGSFKISFSKTSY